MADTSVKIGDLVITISGDTRSIEAAGKRTTESMKKVDQAQNETAANIERNARRALVVMTAAFTGIAYAIGQSISSMAELGRQAEALGITTQEMSKLNFAAETTGATFEQLTQAMSRLATGTRVVNETTIALGNLGIRARDAQGNVRSFTEIIGDIAEVFSKLPNGMQKSQLAIQLFGDSGARLIPLLNQGREGLSRLGAEAERAGVVIDTETAQKAEKLVQATHRLNAALRGVVQNIAINMTPQLQSLAGSLENVARKMSEQEYSWGRFMQMLSMRGAGRSLEEVRSFMAMLDHQARQAAATAANLRGLTDIELAGLIPLNEQRRIGNATLERYNELKALGKSVTEQTMTSQEALAHRERELTAALEQGAITRETYNRALRDASVAYVEAQNATAASLGVTFTAQEQMLQQQARIEEAFRRGAISAQMYARAMQNASVTSSANMQALATQVASTLTAVFAKSKAAGIASAIINTAVGVTQALRTYPPPLSFAMAGLVAAQGAAQIAAIRSTNETGGSGAAPVAGGGASAPSTAAAPAQSSSTLYVEGINPNAIFTGTTMRDFAKRLIEYQKQGGTIVLADA